MLQFWQHCQIIREPTINAFAAVEVHPRGKAKHQGVVIRVRSSMERCQRDSKVVRHHRRLCTGKGDLRTSERPLFDMALGEFRVTNG